ncbi:MAG TPA: type II secretion system protein [bacterium]|nr:type II secretion system protein [bacterium]
MRTVRSENGFTFMEVLAVVMLLGILALVALPNYFGTQAGAQQAVRKSNVEAINTAIALYQYNNSGACPGQAGQPAFNAFMGNVVYFPDGQPLDPTASPPSSASFNTNYSSVTCRTK